MTPMPASFHHSGLPRECISPLVVTREGSEQFPGVASGTGFFVKRDREVFFLTALHCLEYVTPSINLVTTAKQLAIPYRISGHTKYSQDYVRFDKTTRLKTNRNEESFVDVVALHVLEEKRSNFQHLLSRATKLPPTGVWLNNFSNLDLVKNAMHANEKITFVVMGYPNQGTSTGIEYDEENKQPPIINAQPALFTGSLRHSDQDNCMMLVQSTWRHSHSGFSGSPVFVQWDSRHGKLSSLAGLLTSP
jgi:hypothetical protein